MMGANNRMDEISKQFDTLYKDAIDNLRFLKTQEWSATNYTLVLQGAIFALIDRAGPNMRSFLVVALIVIPAIAVLVILQAETSMAKFRNRLNYIYQHHFDARERKALGLQAKPHYLFPILLSGVCIFVPGVILSLKW